NAELAKFNDAIVAAFNAIAPVPVIGPPDNPAPVCMLATVPTFDVLALMCACIFPNATLTLSVADNATFVPKTYPVKAVIWFVGCVCADGANVVGLLGIFAQSV